MCKGWQGRSRRAELGGKVYNSNPGKNTHLSHEEDGKRYSSVLFTLFVGGGGEIAGQKEEREHEGWERKLVNSERCSDGESAVE